MMRTKSLLLVEDDQVDARTVKRALSDVGIVDEVIHMTNGEDALDFLKSDANEKPCLILLDLNMPKMNGHEFLMEAKNNLVIRRIPIVILTTSKEERDVLGTFEYSVAGYMVKPINYKEFVDTIRAISEYWALSLLPMEI